MYIYIYIYILTGNEANLERHTRGVQITIVKLTDTLKNL